MELINLISECQHELYLFKVYTTEGDVFITKDSDRLVHEYGDYRVTELNARYKNGYWIYTVFLDW